MVFLWAHNHVPCMISFMTRTSVEAEGKDLALSALKSVGKSARGRSPALLQWLVSQALLVHLLTHTDSKPQPVNEINHPFSVPMILQQHAKQLCLCLDLGGSMKLQTTFSVPDTVLLRLRHTGKAKPKKQQWVCVYAGV